MSVKFRDRIKRFERVPASQIFPNPKNWREHGPTQRKLLRTMLERIGFADALLVREMEDGLLMLVDGHLRQDIAKDAEVPVLVLDLSEQEADELLATLDPLAALADINVPALNELFQQSAEPELFRQFFPEVNFDGLPSAADWAGAAGGIAPDAGPVQQMTFTLSHAQAEVVKQALELAKVQNGAPPDPENPNPNGNALAAIAEAYCGGS